MSVMHLFCHEAKQPNLKLKTRPKQLLGSLLLAFALPCVVNIAQRNHPKKKFCIKFTPFCKICRLKAVEKLSIVMKRSSLRKRVSKMAPKLIGLVPAIS
jgi:hypothetical protein